MKTTQTQKTTITQHQLTLTREEILELLRATYEIPEFAEVRFRLPEGVIWGGMEVGVDKENPIYIAWEETTEEFSK